MSLTIPNTFTTGTTIEADKIQENVDAIKEYLNGEIIKSDLDTDWVEAKHIMKGVYFSTDNHYEMVSGVYAGVPTSELPVFNPGYAGKYLGTSVPDAVPGTGISFYLHDDADVMVQFQCSPRGLSLKSGVDGGALELRLDGEVANYTQQRISKEVDPQQAAVAVQGSVGFYRRRFYQCSVLLPVVSAGYHHISLYYRGDLRAVPIKFCSYSLEAFYRP